jgi:hypothetical protein
MWNEKISAMRIFKKSYDDSTTSTLVGQTSGDVGSGKDPSFGTNAIAKTFYGKNNGCGEYNWVETPPKQLKKKIAIAYDRVAIKIYKVKDDNQPTISGHTPFKIYRVQLQSPILVEAIMDIVKEENVFLEATEVATFDTPFKPLYFCYDKIMALHRKCEEDTALRQHLNLLVQVMNDMFGGFMTQIKHLNASRLISYKLAWTYFPRSSIVFCGTEDCERLCRVVDTQYQQKPPQMNILAEELRFDGESFAWKPITLEVPYFEGNLPITELPSYPLAFHEDQESVKARLIARGKKVLEYQELKYREYTGIGIYKKGREFKRHNVSDIMNEKREHYLR